MGKLGQVLDRATLSIGRAGQARALGSVERVGVRNRARVVKNASCEKSRARTRVVTQPSVAAAAASALNPLMLRKAVS